MSDDNHTNKKQGFTIPPFGVSVIKFFAPFLFAGLGAYAAVVNLKRDVDESKNKSIEQAAELKVIREKTQTAFDRIASLENKQSFMDKSITDSLNRIENDLKDVKRDVKDVQLKVK